jgi:hypothetical protein
MFKPEAALPWIAAMTHRDANAPFTLAPVVLVEANFVSKKYGGLSLRAGAGGCPCHQLLPPAHNNDDWVLRRWLNDAGRCGSEEEAGSREDAARDGEEEAREQLYGSAGHCVLHKMVNISN